MYNINNVIQEQLVELSHLHRISMYLPRNFSMIVCRLLMAQKVFPNKREIGRKEKVLLS